MSKAQGEWLFDDDGYCAIGLNIDFLCFIGVDWGPFGGKSYTCFAS